MLTRKKGMRIPWKLLFFVLISSLCEAQDYDSGTPPPPAVNPKEIEQCDGIFLSYIFQGREKEYPFVKNVSAQAWSFQSMVTLMNTGSQELKSWQVFVGFHHHEMLVSADNAVIVGGDGFPVRVGENGTVLAGYPQTDLKTAIDTASDMTQIKVEIGLKGSQFGLAEKSNPMPKTIKLVNDGFKCPAATQKGTYMYACCKKDPNYKEKKVLTKFNPRQHGDLSLTYDVLRAYESKYQAQVTIDNNHPLGRLDEWRLTWEWMRNEFISDMKGAYTLKKDPSECIYGPQGKYYKDLDFSTVMNCQKKPVIADLPPEKENDDNVGRLPYCCKNGTLLPKTMNETKARAIFQLDVLKLPPDMNRTALNPPQNWNIVGRLNPTYKCGAPIRVDPTEFPDSSGIIGAKAYAVASWQVTCNMTRPKPTQSKCCVSYSAYYSDAAVPCNTCACGCADDNSKNCDKNASPMLIPTEALLVPFDNRMEKAKAFAHLKHAKIPPKLPCPDNCGVSINWHIDSDYKDGWSARITLFNWDDRAFADWHSAVELKKAFKGFEKAYSFNATKLDGANDTIFLQGLQGLTYLVGETNGSRSGDPRIPGKQQTVISFNKKELSHLKVPEGDGFPSRMFFNGEECALPKELPKRSGAFRSSARLISSLLLAVLTFVLLNDLIYGGN